MLIQQLFRVRQSGSHKRDQIEVPTYLSQIPRKTGASVGKTTCSTTAQCQMPAKLLLLKRQSKKGNGRDKGNSSKTNLEEMEMVKKTKAHLALINQAKLIKMVRLMAHQPLTRTKRKEKKSRHRIMQEFNLKRLMKPTLMMTAPYPKSNQMRVKNSQMENRPATIKSLQPNLSQKRKRVKFPNSIHLKRSNLILIQTATSLPPKMTLTRTRRAAVTMTTREGLMSLGKRPGPKTA